MQITVGQTRSVGLLVRTGQTAALVLLITTAGWLRAIAANPPLEEMRVAKPVDNGNGIAQAVGAQVDPSGGVLAGHLVFLAVLALRPQGLIRARLTA